MFHELLLCLERCGICGALFAICRCCYRGQTYGGDECRARARASQIRSASMRVAAGFAIRGSKVGDSTETSRTSARSLPTRVIAASDGRKRLIR
jgi:hypothetical protein